MMNEKTNSLFRILLLSAMVILLLSKPEKSGQAQSSMPHQGDSVAKTERKIKALESREEAYIDSALKMMSMDRQSPGFKKDLIDDNYRLEKVQNSLHKPLELPDACDKLDEQWKTIKGISEGLKIQIEQLGKWWNISDTSKQSIQTVQVNTITNKAPHELQSILNPLLSAIYVSQSLTDKAFQNLTANEKKYMAKKIIPTLLLKEDSSKDDFQLDAEKINLKLAGDDTLPKINRRDTIYPEDLKVLELTLKINYGALHQAGIILATAMDKAIDVLTKTDLSKVKTKNMANDVVSGDVLFYAETPLGTIIIGGAGENLYKKDAMLIIDIGGNDRYLNRAAGAIGTGKSAIAAVIDLAGNDFYSSHKKFSQGSGVFGIGILADWSGNDTYQAAHFCQGSGLFGIGILWDKGSANDYFSGDTFCQGAGGWGTGILYNESGETNYFAYTFAQGVGYTLGIGAIVDGSGNDYYIAAGTMENNRLYSLSQGFGQGNRPVASGGIGILIDCTGDDHYSAIFYAQGCSYWYGLGILIDDAGTDRYDAQVYAQGCGIHLSTGVLIDRGGSDFYNCTYGGNAQGAAHDFSVGILIDKSGSDTYIGRGNNQGSAITNAFALFIDSDGDDVYHTPTKGGQGIGGEATRGYGNIGIFLDLGGNDFYSEQSLNPGCGTSNNNNWLKGNKGAGIDVEKK